MGSYSFAEVIWEFPFFSSLCTILAMDDYLDHIIIWMELCDASDRCATYYLRMNVYTCRIFMPITAVSLEIHV